MTLVVNLSVMTLAFYAVLFYMNVTRRAGYASRWAAPAMDPRLLIAVVLICRRADARDGAGAVLLDVLQPAAVDAADARPVGGRTLQRRPAQFRARSSIRAGRAGVARGALLRAAEPRAVRRQGRSRARHAGRGDARRATRWPMPCVYIAHPADRRRSRSSGAGTSSDADGRAHASMRCSQAIARSSPPSRCCSPVSVGIQVRSRSRLAAVSSPRTRSLWLQPGRRREAPVARLRQRRRRRLLDARRRLLRRRSGRGGRAGANYDLLYPLLDLVTTLDPHFRVAYRFGAIFLTEAYPSGPGRPDHRDRAAQRGIERDGGALGVHARHRLRLLLVAAGLPQAPRSGSTAPARRRARRRG